MPGYLLTVSFENGAELSRHDAINSTYDLVLGAAAAPIPTADVGALVLLALGIAAAALFVMKGRG